MVSKWAKQASMTSVVAGAVAGSFFMTAPAWADGNSGTINGSVFVRSGPSKKSAMVGHLTNGQYVEIVCQQRGTFARGPERHTNLWDRLPNGTYVSDAYVHYPPGPNRPQMCGAKPANSSVSGSRVIRSAEKYLGIPYVFGATNPKVGLDCSSFIQRAYRDLGIKLPRNSWNQAKAGRAVPSLKYAQPGDILAFQSAGSPRVHHVALYLSPGRMMAAPQPGENVKRQAIYETPVAIRRIVVPPAPAAPAAPPAPPVPPAPPGSAPALAAEKARKLAEAEKARKLAEAYQLVADDMKAKAEAAAKAAGIPPSPAPSASPSPAASPKTTVRNVTALDSVPYAAIFKRVGKKHGISPSILAAVAKTESDFDNSVVSPDGAQGLMQFMPETAKGWGVNSWDPNSSIDGAARLLLRNKKEFGTWELAFAAYNAGGGAVRKYNGVPPYRETQNYVKKVRAAKLGLDRVVGKIVVTTPK